jgi:hypothetical protein
MHDGGECPFLIIKDPLGRRIQNNSQELNACFFLSTRKIEIFSHCSSAYYFEAKAIFGWKLQLWEMRQKIQLVVSHSYGKEECSNRKKILDKSNEPTAEDG